MLVTTGADGQTCVWDMALERDAEEEAALGPELGGENNAELPSDVPAQLLVRGGRGVDAAALGVWLHAAPRWAPGAGSAGLSALVRARRMPDCRA